MKRDCNHPSSHLNPFQMSDTPFSYELFCGNLFLIPRAPWLRQSTTAFVSTQILSDSSHNPDHILSSNEEKQEKIPLVFLSTNILMISVCILWLLSHTTYLQIVLYEFWIDTMKKFMASLANEQHTSTVWDCVEKKIEEHSRVIPSTSERDHRWFNNVCCSSTKDCCWT